MIELAYEFLPCHRALRRRDTRLIAVDAASTTATTADLFVLGVFRSCARLFFVPTALFIEMYVYTYITGLG